MDRKAIIILAICFLALMVWFPLVNKLYPPKPLPESATNILRSAQATISSNPPALTPQAVTNAPIAPPTMSAASLPVVRADATE